MLLNFLEHSYDSLKYNLAGFSTTILPFDQERLSLNFRLVLGVRVRSSGRMLENSGAVCVLDKK